HTALIGNAAKCITGDNGVRPSGARRERPCSLAPRRAAPLPGVRHVLARVHYVRAYAAGFPHAATGGTVVRGSDVAEGVTTFNGVICVGWWNSGNGNACESCETCYANLQ